MASVSEAAFKRLRSNIAVLDIDGSSIFSLSIVPRTDVTNFSFSFSFVRIILFVIKVIRSRVPVECYG